MDVAKAAREMKNNDNPAGPKPERTAVTVSQGETDTSVHMKRDGHDIDHAEKLRKHNTRKDVCKENKPKTHALTIGSCNKTMRHRAEEASDFEDDIRDHPM